MVGGHCIGVDPYYLTHKAQEHGYNPEIILAGRKLNDGMSEYVSKKLISKMNHISIDENKKVLIMGLTFKENCPDTRNSKVFDIVDYLKTKNIEVDICDPWVDQNQLSQDYKLISRENLSKNLYHGIIVAVSHKEFIEMGIDFIRSLGTENSVIYDLKHIFKEPDSDLRL